MGPSLIQDAALRSPVLCRSTAGKHNVVSWWVRQSRCIQKMSFGCTSPHPWLLHFPPLLWWSRNRYLGCSCWGWGLHYLQVPSSCLNTVFLFYQTGGVSKDTTLVVQKQRVPNKPRWVLHTKRRDIWYFGCSCASLVFPNELHSFRN